MIIIPAIDMIGGRCVRLVQGDYRRKTEYSDDPAAAARRWQEEGAELIHLVDLDGAKAGTPRHIETVRSVRGAVTCELEIGGGVRSLADIETYLDMGVERVVLGTVIFRDRKLFQEAAERYGERIVVGLDVKDGRPAVSGWGDTVQEGVNDTLTVIEATPVRDIIFTEISRDGMMSGCDIEAVRRLLDATGKTVIASGGVSSLEDVNRLTTLSLAYNGRLRGAIVGKALYEGVLTLTDAARCGRR